MKTISNDNDAINELVTALVYAKHLIENPKASSPAERAATMVHIDELIALFSPRETSEEQGMEDCGKDYWRLEK